MLRRIQKMFCALLIAVLVASTMTPALAKSVTARVSSTSAKVYRSASRASDSVRMKKGTKVTVTAVSGSWAKVRLNGKTGYMPTKYLSATASSSSSSPYVSKSTSGSSRYTAYVSRSTYVYKRASSSSDRRSISTNTKVYVVGKSGSYYKVQNSKGSATGYIKTNCVSRSKVSANIAKGAKRSKKSWKSKVVKMQWFKNGKNVLKRGSYGYIYDIDTGVSLRIKRMGGTNHADVEPATTADTAKLLRVAGGKFSWKSHAVILKAGGKYVACGINTKPHGDQTIKNNHYDGQFCLHMTGSITHGREEVNANHQASINRAYNWAHSK